MSDLADTFAQIEHVEFIANAVGAEDAETFFSLTRTRPPVKAVMADRDAASLVARIKRLMEQPVSKNYMHPMDAPIAVYLDCIFRMEAADALRTAWDLVRGNQTLYWTNQVALSINRREQSADALDAAMPDATPEPAPDALVTVKTASLADPPIDPASFPAAPAPVDKETLAKMLYTEYMAASKVEVEAGGRTFPPRPPWGELPEDHMFRRIFRQTCEATLAKLAAVPFVPDPPEEPTHRQAVATAIRTGQITARMTLVDVG